MFILFLLFVVTYTAIESNFNIFSLQFPLFHTKVDCDAQQQLKYL